jgi:hypothetical protein
LPRARVKTVSHDAALFSPFSVFEEAWWRKQSCETGLEVNNREFFANSGSEQAFHGTRSFSLRKFASAARHLVGPRATFLLLRRSGDLSPISGIEIRHISCLQPDIRAGGSRRKFAVDAAPVEFFDSENSVENST